MKKSFLVKLLITVLLFSIQNSKLLAQCYGLVSYPTPNQAIRYLFANSTVDGSGLGNSAVLTGTPLPIFTTDRYGNALNAISISGASQLVNNLSQSTGIADFTLSIWIKSNTSVGGWIVGRQNPGHDRKIIMNDNGIVKFGIYNGSIITTSSLTALNDNKWHHIVATHSTVSTGTIALYVDNVFQSSASTKSTDGTTGYWQIGNGTNWGGANGSTSNQFNGQLDDFVYYTRVLSTPEIAQLYGSSTTMVDNTPIINGGDLILSVASFAGANYSWTGPNFFTANTNSVTISGANEFSSGSYLVSISGTCATVTSKTINIVGNPGAISGQTAICPNAGTLGYSISSVTNATAYNWTVPSNVTLISGQGTNSINVSFSGVAFAGSIGVSASTTQSYSSTSFLSFTTTSNNLNPIYPLNSMVLQYLFNGNGNDASGNANNAVITGSPIYVTDRFGNPSGAVSITGASQYFSSSQTTTNPIDFTLIGWFKTTSTQGGKIIGLGNNQTTSSAAYDRNIYMSNNGFVYFETYNNGYNIAQSSQSFNDGAWHQAVAISSSTNGMALYIDGVLVGTNSLVANASYTGYWKVGNDNVAGMPNQPTNAYFSGSIDDVTIYSRSLSSSEISQTYANNYIIDNNPVCAGSNLILNVGTLSGATYAWTGPNSFSSSISSPTILGVASVANSGLYNLSINYKGCSFPALSKSITIGGGIVNTISGAQNVCVGSVPLFGLSSTVSPSNINYAYLWETSTVSGSSGFVSAVGVNTNSGYTFTTAINTNTWVRMTVLINGCTYPSTAILMTATSNNLSTPNTYPSGYWNAYSYGQQFFVSSSYAGYWTIGGLNFDTRTTATGYGSNVGSPSNAQSYQGCQVDVSNFSFRIRGQNMVTSSGIYAITIPYYDDGVNFLINGITYYSDPAWYGGTKSGSYVGPINPSDLLEFNITQGTGGNGIAVTMVTTVPSPLANGGTISSAITNVCQGGNLATSNTSFTGSTAFTGGCNVSSTAYQWQSSFDGSAWNNLSGGIYANYLYNQAIMQTTYFRRAVTDLCGNPALSNVITVNINFSGADPTVPGANVWNSYLYYDRSINGTTSTGPLAGTLTMPGMNYTTPGLSFDTRNYFTSGTSPSNAPGAQGCPIPSSNISAKFIRTGFPAGTYQFDIPFIDDQTWMFVNNQPVAQQTGCCVVVNNFFTGSLTPTDIVEFRWSQGGGGSGLYISVTGPNVTTTSPIAGTVGPQAIACSNDIPTQTFTTVNTTSGGCVAKSYQWQGSTVSGTAGFNNIVNATSQVLTPGFTLYATTWLRRIDTDYCGNVVTLNGALLSVTGTVPGDTSQFGNNSWISYGFNSYAGANAASVVNIANFTSYRGYATINGTNFTSTTLYSTSSSPSYIQGYQGCSILTSQHSTITKRSGFPQGQYNILFQHDDPGVVFINGIAVYSSAYINGGFDVTNWYGNLGSTDKIEIRQSNNNGPSSYGIQLVSTTVAGVTSAGTIGTDQVVCSNSTGIVITSTGVATTSGCFIYYKWLSSTVAGLASSVNTLTGLTLSSNYTTTSPISQTTYFQRLAIDACGSVLGSNIVTISVNGIFLAGSINTVSGVCIGASPSTITSLTLPTGALGTYTYVWQTSADNSTWTSIATATGVNYTQLYPISSPTYFRRSVTSGSCGTLFTPSVLASTLPPTAITSQPVNSTVCGAFALFTVGTSGVSPTYQWQMSTTAGQFFNLTGPTFVIKTTTFTGVTSSVLSVSGTIISVSGSNYRVLVNSGCGPLVTSSGAAGLFQGPPSITSQPTSAAVCIGNQAVYNVVASSPILSYQWKQSTDGGTTYSNISDNTTFAGTNSGSLTVNGLALAMTGFKYLGVLSTTCITLTSTGAAITVTGTIASQSITGPSFVCPNTSAALTGAAPVGGGGTFIYQWQISTISGSTGFVNGTGATATTLGYNTPNLSVPAWFSRIATSSSGCQDISTALGVGLNQATVATIVNPSANVNSCLGATLVITATASGTGSLAYYWRAVNTFLSDNSIYSGSNTSSLTISGISSTTAGINYNVSVTSSVCASATSGNRQVSTILTPIGVTTNPTNYITCQGNAVVFGVVTTGSGAAFRWQVCTDGGNSNYADLGNSGNYTGVNTAAMLINPVPIGFNNYSYRAKVDGTCSATQYSNYAVLTVSSAVSGNSITSATQPQNLCAGVTPTSFAGTSFPTLQGGNSSFNYNWQFSTDNATFFDFTPTSVTSVNYSPSSTLSGTTYFRRLVYSFDCPASASNSLTVVVNQPTNIAANPVTTGICQGSNAAFAISATGLNVSYTWQYATSTLGGGNWANVNAPIMDAGNLNFSSYSNTPNLGITAPPLATNNYQFRTNVNSDCGTGNALTSTGASLLVNPSPTFVINPPTSIAFCEGATVLVISSATGVGTVNYQWQESLLGSGGPFNNITNTGSFLGSTQNALSIVGANVSQSGYAYRSMAYIGGCSLTGANSATLNPSNNSWTGTVSKDWFNPSNWCGVAVPIVTSNISIVNTSNSPIITTTGALVRSITITGGALLSISAANSLSVSGNWLNNGTFTGNTSTVYFNGTGSQSIGGSSNSNFYNLNVTNTVGTNITSSQSVKGTLTVGASTTLNSGGNLILYSDVNGTGRLETLPTGASVSGNVTVQNYMGAKINARLLSFPVQNAAISQLKSNIWVTGIGTGFDAGSTTPTIYTYVESVTGSINYGKTRISSTASLLLPGTGYEILVRSRSLNVAETRANQPMAAVTLNVTGVLNQGNISLPLSYSNTGNATADGWNLVGNPYPSQVDWAGAGWTKTKITNNIYFLDPGSSLTSATSLRGQAYTYLPGIGCSPAVAGCNSLIAQGQGFYVLATASGASLSLTEAVKTGGSSRRNFRIETVERYDLIRVSINGTTGLLDETIVRLGDNYTDSYDNGNDDVLKFSNSILNVSTRTKEGYSVVMNSTSIEKEEKVIPVEFSSTQGDSYTVAVDATSLSASMPEVYIRDNTSKTETKVTGTGSVSFTYSLGDSTAKNKYSLVLRKAIVNDTVGTTGLVGSLDRIVNLFPNPLEGDLLKVELKGIKDETITISIQDALGGLSFQNEFSKLRSERQLIYIDSKDFSSGIYLMKVQGNGWTKAIKFVKL